MPPEVNESFRKAADRLVLRGTGYGTNEKAGPQRTSLLLERSRA